MTVHDAIILFVWFYTPMILIYIRGFGCFFLLTEAKWAVNNEM